MSGALFDAAANQDFVALHGKRLITGPVDGVDGLRHFYSLDLPLLLLIPLISFIGSSNREKHGGGEKDAD